MHKRLLGFVNIALSKQPLETLIAFSSIFFPTFGFSVLIARALGVGSGLELLFLTMLISIMIGFLFLILRGVRWNLIAWGIRREMDWFSKRRPKVLIGIGPGGAILAGIVAKTINERMGYEPSVVVANRTNLSRQAVSQVKVTFYVSLETFSHRDLESSVIITPEVHSGETLREVCRILKKKNNIEPETFTITSSPNGLHPVPKTPS
jgi:FlaA1/EpsC-like NDP-sugar epimerase